MTENKSGSKPKTGSDANAQDSAAISSDQMVAFLALLRDQSKARGLNLFHAWSAAELRQTGIGWFPDTTPDSTGLVLMFGNAGGDFWQHFQQYSESLLPQKGNLSETLASILMNAELGPDPIDAFAVKQASRAINAALDGLSAQSEPALANWALAPRFVYPCLLYTSPSPRDATLSRMPSSA